MSSPGGSGPSPPRWIGCFCDVGEHGIREVLVLLEIGRTFVAPTLIDRCEEVDRLCEHDDKVKHVACEPEHARVLYRNTFYGHDRHAEVQGFFAALDRAMVVHYGGEADADPDDPDFEHVGWFPVPCPIPAFLADAATDSFEVIVGRRSLVWRDRLKHGGDAFETQDLDPIEIAEFAPAD